MCLKNMKNLDGSAPLGTSKTVDQKPARQLLLENQLCFSLYSASRLVVQSYQPLLKPLGITYPQYLVMLVLWELGELSVSELGGKLLLDSGTLSPLLKKLQEKKLVHRKRSKADERTVLVSLTETGTKLQSKAKDIPSQLLCLTGKSVQELMVLKSELHGLSQELLSSMEQSK